MLKPVYTEQEATSIAKLLLEDFGYNVQLLVQNEEEVLDKSEISQIQKWIEELHTNKPVQYVLGYSWFMDNKIYVNEHCLIPRQETEELVLEIIGNTNKFFDGNILDIGTGSACISVILKSNFPKAMLFASDISTQSLSIAQRNSFIYNSEIKFIEDNILNPDFSKYPNCDIIVSNPPYVRLLEKEEMQKNVLDYEPHQALFVADEEALLFYRSIIAFSLKKLNKKGKLYFEINEVFGNEISNLLHENAFINIEIIKDIHDKDRMIKAEKK